MYPHERSLVERLADQPFAIVGVNSDKDRAALQEVLKKERITWRSFWNGPLGTDGPISRRWNTKGWPYLVLIDPDGVIRQKWAGSPGEQVLDQAIGECLARAAQGN